jgi:DNA-binding CsgD family transcriptional regulator
MGGHPLAALSPRELEVLEQAAQGRTNSQVAADLCLSIHAVKFHLAGIYRKLGVTNRTEAASVYFRALDPSAAGRRWA